MSGTYVTVMGDRGRVVIPSELREEAGLEQGQPLVLMATEHGVLLLTRTQLKEMVRANLTGLDLVAELTQERRRAAATEDS